jgi:hypothetical protein
MDVSPRSPARRTATPHATVAVCRLHSGHRQNTPRDRPGHAGLPSRARVLFATAAEWVARLAEAHRADRIQAELTRLGRYPLMVVDEVGYTQFEPEAANLFFQLVSLATNGPA